MNSFWFKDATETVASTTIKRTEDAKGVSNVASGHIYIKDLGNGQTAVYNAFKTIPEELPDRKVFWMHLWEFNDCKNESELLDMIQERYRTYNKIDLHRSFAKQYIGSYDIIDEYVWFHL